MVSIFEETPGYGAILGRGLGNAISGGIQSYAQMQQQKKQNEQLKNLIGIDLSGISPDLQKVFVQQMLEGQEKERLNAQKVNQLKSLIGEDQTKPYDQKLAGMQQQPQQGQFSASERLALGGHPEIGRVFAEGEKAQKREEQKIRAEERGILGEESKKFFSKLADTQESLPLLEDSLNAQIDAVLKGDVNPWSRGHVADIARSLGAPSSLVAPLETPGSKQFKAGLKTYLSHTLKDAFRGATTGREIDLAEGLLAQAGVSKAGNLAALWLQQSQLEIAKEKIQLANQLRQEGMSPYEIPSKVNKMLIPYRKEVSKEYFEALNHLKGR